MDSNEARRHATILSASKLPRLARAGRGSAEWRDILLGVASGRTQAVSPAMRRGSEADAAVSGLFDGGFELRGGDEDSGGEWRIKDIHAQTAFEQIGDGETLEKIRATPDGVGTLSIAGCIAQEPTLDGGISTLKTVIECKLPVHRAEADFDDRAYFFGEKYDLQVAAQMIRAGGEDAVFVVINPKPDGEYELRSFRLTLDDLSDSIAEARAILAAAREDLAALRELPALAVSTPAPPARDWNELAAQATSADLATIAGREGLGALIIALAKFDQAAHEAGAPLRDAIDNRKPELEAIANETGKNIALGDATAFLRGARAKVQIVDPARLPSEFWKPNETKLTALIKSDPDAAAALGVSVVGGGAALQISTRRASKK